MTLHDFSPEAHQVIYTTLAEVAHRYGDGKRSGALASYPYHNLSHAIAVMEGSIELTTHLGMSRAAIELAAMSGAAHDVIRERSIDATPEQASAIWLRDTMQSYGYGDTDTTTTTAAILATTATLDEHGVLVAQTHDIDANTDAGKIALCVASADVRALYRPDGPRIAHDYFRELQGLSGDEVPRTLDGLREYQEGEVVLTRGYRYPLAAAETLFATRREQTVAHHARVLALLEDGQLTDWYELERLDTAYYRQYTS